MKGQSGGLGFVGHALMIISVVLFGIHILGISSFAGELPVAYATLFIGLFFEIAVVFNMPFFGALIGAAIIEVIVFFILSL